MKPMRKVICLIETSRSHGRGLLRGIAKYARLHGPWMFYREDPAEDYFTSEKKKRLTDWADGFIYWPHFDKRSTDINPAKKTAQVFKFPIPGVMTTAESKILKEQRVIIDADLKAYAEMAVTHLTQRGFKDIAFCGFHETWSDNLGMQVENVTRKQKCNFHLYNARQFRNISWQKERQALSDWLKQLPKPTGVIACNDDRSQDIIEACKIAQLLVPEDLAILGFDNDEFICELSHIPISSIAIDTEQAGYLAAEQLDQMMNRKKPTTKNITIEPAGVVTRRSTDIFAVKDNNIAVSLAYIHNNAIHPIQVPDVVANTTISRRALEQRFQKQLNRTVLEEIRRKRTELIQKFLIETDMSLSRISITMNFPSVDNMSQFFKRSTGQSIAAWRKQHQSK